MQEISKSCYLGIYDRSHLTSWNKDQDKQDHWNRQYRYKSTLFTQEYHFLGDYMGTSADFYVVPRISRFIDDLKYRITRGNPLETLIFDVKVISMYGEAYHNISIKAFLNIKHKVFIPLQDVLKRLLSISNVQGNAFGE